jgi:type II secretory pathway pseudopilin PulG
MIFGTQGQRPPTRCKEKGFTLLEITILLVVIGFVAGMAMLSWSSFAEARRAGQTKSQLRHMKECLQRTILVTEHYPREADFKACSAAVGKDAWGNAPRWLVGADSEGSGLCERDAVVSDEARGQTAASIHNDSKIILPDAEGGEQGGVAFALISLGKDGKAANATYDKLDTGPWAEILASGSQPSPPDFSDNRDDMVLVVKAYELSAAIRHAVGP